MRAALGERGGQPREGRPASSTQAVAQCLARPGRRRRPPRYHGSVTRECPHRPPGPATQIWTDGRGRLPTLSWPPGTQVGRRRPPAPPPRRWLALGALALVFARPAGAMEVTLPHLAVTLAGAGLERLVEEEGAGPWGAARIAWHSSTGADGITRRVAHIQPRRAPRPSRLARFLSTWRKSHGCVARTTRAFFATRRRAATPPQLTFQGSCEGGDHYRLRVLVVGGAVYLLQVHGSVVQVSATSLDGAFRELLASVRISTDAQPR